MTLSINIDESTAACLNDLKIGFQAKRVTSKASHPNVAQDGKYSQLSVMDGNSQNSGEKQFIADPDQLSSNKKSQESVYNKRTNSIRVKNGTSSLEGCDNWVLTEGVYSKGKILAKVPKMTEFDPDNLSYLVDVALNGQQFTGKPVNFRYYDVKIQQVEPPLGPSIGGTNIKI